MAIHNTCKIISLASRKYPLIEIPELIPISKEN